MPRLHLLERAIALALGAVAFLALAATAAAFLLQGKLWSVQPLMLATVVAILAFVALLGSAVLSVILWRWLKRLEKREAELEQARLHLSALPNVTRAVDAGLSWLNEGWEKGRRD